MARRKRDQKTKDLFAYAEDNCPSIVYMAINKVNGKRYIGITRKTLERRKAEHLSRAKLSVKECRHFHYAISKHGDDAFVFETICRCDTYKEAAKEEIRLIAELCPEYNASLGGDGVAGVGTRASAETRRRLSLSHLGKPGFWTGKKRSRESIEKRTATRALNPVRPWLGKKRPAETGRKIAQAKRKWIMCIDDGMVYHGLRAAGAAYGIKSWREIARICTQSRPRAKTVKGLRFRYVEPPQ